MDIFAKYELCVLPLILFFLFYVYHKQTTNNNNNNNKIERKKKDSNSIGSTEKSKLDRQLVPHYTGDKLRRWKPREMHLVKVVTEYNG